MNKRTFVAAGFTIALSFLVVPSAQAKDYNNGGSGAGLTGDEPTVVVASPVSVAAVVAAPVVVAPAAAAPAAAVAASPVVAAPAAQAPAAASNINVLSESIENIPTAAAAIAAAPAAVASQAEISFTGANSLTMTGGAGALGPGRQRR